jgi:outer membrane protein OmpA-like peptidoglycan-associated protein
LWDHLSPISTANNDGTYDRVGGTKGGLAFQGIVGAAYPLAMVAPGLDLTVEYRYQEQLENGNYGGTHYQPFGVNRGYVGLSTPQNHSIMVGVRYALWQPPAPPPPAPPAPTPPPAVEAARTYLVFFDWDRSDLTERARQIVSEAAQASTHVQTTRIEVNGYTDLSGTAAYNQKLSVRRAESVESELVRDGVAQNEISIHGYGESNPLVPTAKGVREPQNRRVEIILH